MNVKARRKALSKRLKKLVRVVRIGGMDVVVARRSNCREWYIPESEKPYFFVAVDGAVMDANP